MSISNEKMNDYDDFINSLSFIYHKEDLKKIEIIYLNYIKDDILESFELIVYYNIYFANVCEMVKVKYFNVTELKLNNKWSNFPSNIIHHDKLIGWDNLNYHVFDINSDGDYFDTISFYCKSFEILK